MADLEIATRETNEQRQIRTSAIIVRNSMKSPSVASNLVQGHTSTVVRGIHEEGM